MTDPTLVSVLVPAYANEEATVERAYREIADVFGDLPGYSLDLVFTDNHPTDATFRCCERSLQRTLAGARDPLLVQRWVTSARCWSATSARGLRGPDRLRSAGSAPADPGNARAVATGAPRWFYGIRRSLPDGPVTAGLRRVFYAGIRALGDEDLPRDRRVPPRRCLHPRRAAQGQRHQPLPSWADQRDGVLARSAYPTTRRGTRRRDAGKSRSARCSAWRSTALLNHSLVPLRVASLTGLAVGVCTFLATLAYLVGRLVFGQAAGGLRHDDDAAPAGDHAQCDLPRDHRRISRPHLHAGQRPPVADHRGGDRSYGGPRPPYPARIRAPDESAEQPPERARAWSTSQIQSDVVRVFVSAST